MLKTCPIHPNLFIFSVYHKTRIAISRDLMPKLSFTENIFLLYLVRAMKTRVFQYWISSSDKTDCYLWNSFWGEEWMGNLMMRNACIAVHRESQVNVFTVLLYRLPRTLVYPVYAGYGRISKNDLIFIGLLISFQPKILLNQLWFSIWRRTT